MVKVQVNPKSGQARVTIPDQYVRALSYVQGTELIPQINKSGNLELVKCENGPVCVDIEKEKSL